MPGLIYQQPSNTASWRWCGRRGAGEGRGAMLAGQTDLGHCLPSRPEIGVIGSGLGLLLVRFCQRRRAPYAVEKRIGGE